MTDKDPALKAAWDILNRFPAHGKGYVVSGFADIIRRHFAEALEERRRPDALLDPEGRFIVMHKKPDRDGPIAGVLGWRGVRTRDEIDEVLGEEPDDE